MPAESAQFLSQLHNSRARQIRGYQKYLSTEMKKRWYLHRFFSLPRSEELISPIQAPIPVLNLHLPMYLVKSLLEHGTKTTETSSFLFHCWALTSFFYSWESRNSVLPCFAVSFGYVTCGSCYPTLVLWKFFSLEPAGLLSSTGVAVKSLLGQLTPHSHWEQHNQEVARSSPVPEEPSDWRNTSDWCELVNRERNGHVWTFQGHQFSAFLLFRFLCPLHASWEVDYSLWEPFQGHLWFTDRYTKTQIHSRIWQTWHAHLIISERKEVTHWLYCVKILLGTE